MSRLLLALLLFAAGVARALPDEPAPAPAEPRTVVVKSARRGPSALEGAAQAVQRAFRRLWEREQPDAARGNELAAQNDPAGALQAYDEAEPKVPAGSDAAAALAFDRSSALLKGEATEAPKALAQALRAAESSDPKLRAKAAYNAALALEQAGKADEAVGAYGQALRLDPDDEDAKVNLELLLRQKEQQRKQPQAGPQDPSKQQQKQDQEQQQQSKGEQKKDEQEQQKQAQQQKQEEKPRQGEQQQEQPKQEQAQQEKKEEPQQPPEQMGRSEAQRLLDAAKAGEKNLQTWRFGKRPEKDRRRTPAEKDW